MNYRKEWGGKESELYTFQGLPAFVYPAPQLSDAFADLVIGLGLPASNTKQYQRGVVGCSDDVRYSDKWEAESYVMVTILAIIGALILIGTLMESIERYTEWAVLLYLLIFTFDMT